MQWVVKLESGISRTKHISDMGHVEFQLHPRLSLQKVGQVTPRRVIKFQMLTIYLLHLYIHLN